MLDNVAALYAKLGVRMSSNSSAGMPSSLLFDDGCVDATTGSSFDGYLIFSYWEFRRMLRIMNDYLATDNASLAGNVSAPDVQPRWAEFRRRLYKISGCFSDYERTLDDFDVWSSSTSGLLSTAAGADLDVSPSVALMNAFVRSGSVLATNVTRYLTGTMST